jgi:hypothetical protein
MSAVRMAIARGFIVMVSGWLLSCSWPRSIVHEEPILPPDFSLAVEKVVHSFSPQQSIWPQALPGVSSFFHKVKWSRETLFSIALWYTGSGENWKRLAITNPTINPNQIHIGDTIQIPEKLLKRRKAMPRDFLKPITSTKGTSPPQPTTPSIKADEITLYGPIGNDTPTPDTKKNDLPGSLETLD